MKINSVSNHPLTLLTAASAVLLAAPSVHATDYTWDGTNNAPWSDAKWSDGINWVNGSGNNAIVNSGDVYADIGITANSLTIGDGVGAAGSASARFATNEWTDLVKDTDYTESVSPSGDIETVTITLTPAPRTEKLFIQDRAERGTG